jgi:CDP-diacylglycerol pyrophosphatase
MLARILGQLRLTAALLAAFSGAGIGWAHADALWTLVHGQCVPDEQRNGDPPCAWYHVPDTDRASGAKSRGVRRE